MPIYSFSYFQIKQTKLNWFLSSLILRDIRYQRKARDCSIQRETKVELIIQTSMITSENGCLHQIRNFFKTVTNYLGPPVEHIQEVADALKKIGDELDNDYDLQR